MTQVYVNPIFQIENGTGLELSINLTSDSGFDIEETITADEFKKIIFGRKSSLIKIVITGKKDLVMREINKERP